MTHQRDMERRQGAGRTRRDRDTARRISVALLIFAIVITCGSCKKKERFAEPEYILKKWARAIEDLNYRDYAACEAYPKSEGVFVDMYREYFVREIRVTRIEDLDEKQIKKGPEGNPFVLRKVEFECREHKRSSGTPVELIRGDVSFIRFLEGIRKNDGWLMWNRTLVRLEK